VSDLVSAKVLTGKVPEVISAWRLVGEGRAAALRVVRLGGRVRFDPNADDWWTATQHARHLLGDQPLATGMKTIANGTAYGNWIRLDQQQVAAKVELHRLDGRTERQQADRPEAPAIWTFPPFASAVTAGGRLLMATLEHKLSEAGGLFASANTDSATVVSTPDGGLVACPGSPEQLTDATEAVRAISWSKLDEVRGAFAELGVDLRLTAENFADGKRHQLYALGVAGSRVVLFTDGPEGRDVVKRSEVALGDLRSPYGRGTTGQFVDESAEWMLSQLLDGGTSSPTWFSLPATTELPMGTPGKVGSLGDQGSPFGFAMGARRARRAAGVFGGEPVRLLAPAGDDVANARWVEVPSGEPVSVAVRDRLGRNDDADAVEIATYGEELVRLALHPESKMIGPDGSPCKATTKGLLRPRIVVARAVHLVGKEGNRLEEVATGEVVDPDEVLIDYGDDEWEGVVLPVLRGATVTEVASRAGMDRCGLSDYLRSRSPRQPPPAAKDRLRSVARALVRDGVARQCTMPGCAAWARPLPSVTCSERHRKAIARQWNA
jgi:hypothetical protein